MRVICINVKPLLGNDVAPALALAQEYEVIEIIKDSKGFEHYNVGLICMYNYITSHDTGEELPRTQPKGRGIHWCHPSRFKIIEQ